MLIEKASYHMTSLQRAQISVKKSATISWLAVIILRWVLPTILLFPWFCQSLVSNLVAGGFPTNLISSSLRLTPVGEIKSSPSLAKRTKLLLRQSEERSSSDHDHDGVIEQEGGRRRDQKLHQQEIYLFSLNWIQESDPEYFRKKDIRRLWEWKDTALGDGRDFFVPKPKTLMALQKYLLKNIPNLTECSIISNCARLEVLCCCNYSIPSNHGKRTREENTIENDEQGLLARDISNCFVTQLNSYQKISKNANAWTRVMMQLPIKADQPESVLTISPPVIDQLQSVSYYDSWWNVTVGAEAILTRLCKVSAGMGHRPRRPERSVVFRPFSSRDAHVLLQLKRTRENIAFPPDDSDSSDDSSISSNNVSYNKKHAENTTIQQQRRKRKFLPVVLDCALRAGKAARNPAIVPEIEELRELTSAESSACSPSDLQISQTVANAAFEKGILPLIKECAIKLDHSTQSIDLRIAEFRRTAFDFLLEIGNDDLITGDEKDNMDRKYLHRELRSWLNRRLHAPTIELRSRSLQQNDNDGRRRDDNGIYDDVESYLRASLNQIRTELDLERHRILEKEKKDERMKSTIR
mmetsp:Transcript_11917/g.25242  ORF Transcript_11917/g.25242 Transcript_11917/m.25242 type:complete len:581 (+) Transcript_11917:55-1797(+)